MRLYSCKRNLHLKSNWFVQLLEQHSTFRTMAVLQQSINTFRFTNIGFIFNPQKISKGAIAFNHVHYLCVRYTCVREVHYMKSIRYNNYIFRYMDSRITRDNSKKRIEQLDAKQCDHVQYKRQGEHPLQGRCFLYKFMVQFSHGDIYTKSIFAIS